MTRFSTISLIAIATALVSSAHAQQETKNFTYDALGRLTTTDVVNGVNNGDTRTICYDSMGNRTEFMTRIDGSLPACGSTPTPSPTPTPTPSPTPTPTPTPTNSPPNSPPNAVNDSINGECYQSVLVNVTSNDTDPDGPASLTVTSVVKTNGQAALVSFSGGTIAVALGPEHDSSDFTYTVSDGLGATDTAVLTTFAGLYCLFDGGGLPPP